MIHAMLTLPVMATCRSVPTAVDYNQPLGKLHRDSVQPITELEIQVVCIHIWHAHGIHMAYTWHTHGVLQYAPAIYSLIVLEGSFGYRFWDLICRD